MTDPHWPKGKRFERMLIERDWQWRGLLWSRKPEEGVGSMYDEWRADVPQEDPKVPGVTVAVRNQFKIWEGILWISDCQDGVDMRLFTRPLEEPGHVLDTLKLHGASGVLGLGAFFAALR